MQTRWGILGTGAIAAKFAEGLTYLPEARLVAVGSRTRASADAFGARWGVSRRHASYEALAADPEVDAVYVATPHPFHAENSLLCLEAGKAVLCEKPFTVNARQAEAVVARARERRLFLMEAMWTRFLPVFVKLRGLLKEGALGEVRMLQSDFGFRSELNPKGRLFNPQLGGGALLDVGVYTVSLASMVLGTPPRIAAHAHLGATGVDEQAALVLGYPGGALALLSAATRTTTPQAATIMGTEGWLRVHAPWWRASRMTLVRGGREETVDAPFEGNGYQFEAAEVGRCLREGRGESDVMPLGETLEIMRTMDEVRYAWGLAYPAEGEAHALRQA